MAAWQFTQLVMLVETSLASTFLDRAVAGLALQAALEVVGVTEEDEVGNVIDTDPVQLFTVAMDLGQLLDRGALRFDRLMAEHALIGLRQARPLLLFHGDMAVRTRQARADVLLVAERDGLRCDGHGELFFFPLENRWDLGEETDREQTEENKT